MVLDQLHKLEMAVKAVQVVVGILVLPWEMLVRMVLMQAVMVDLVIPGVLLELIRDQVVEVAHNKKPEVLVALDL
jgi:hypothetical protein